jgi:hypothetical protein
MKDQIRDLGTKLTANEDDDAYQDKDIYSTIHSQRGQAVSELNEEQLMICRHLVQGYSLHMNKWS